MEKNVQVSIETKEQEESKKKIYRKKRLRAPRRISLGMERERD